MEQPRSHHHQRCACRYAPLILARDEPLEQLVLGKLKIGRVMDGQAEQIGKLCGRPPSMLLGFVINGDIELLQIAIRTSRRRSSRAANMIAPSGSRQRPPPSLKSKKQKPGE